MKADEFDRKFDRGEDITAALDMAKAHRPGGGTTTRQRRLPCLDDRRAGPRSPPTRRHPPIRDQSLARRTPRTPHTRRMTSPASQIARHPDGRAKDAPAQTSAQTTSGHSPRYPAHRRGPISRTRRTAWLCIWRCDWGGSEARE